MSEESAPGDMELIEAVSDHVDRHLGETDLVLHEERSPHVHVDLLPVPPAEDRPFQVVVTCGMAALPMHPPDDHADLRWTELLVLLPPEWPMEEEAMRDERNWWPLRMLKWLARFPHAERTALWRNHTIDNGEPLVEGSDLCGAILALPFTLPEAFATLPHPHHPDEDIVFHMVIPIHRAEMELARSQGSAALWAAFEEADVDPVIDPARPSAV